MCSPNMHTAPPSCSDVKHDAVAALWESNAGGNQLQVCAGVWCVGLHQLCTPSLLAISKLRRINNAIG
jgi:hypothetical protein